MRRRSGALESASPEEFVKQFGQLATYSAQFKEQKYYTDLKVEFLQQNTEYKLQQKDESQQSEEKSEEFTLDCESNSLPDLTTLEKFHNLSGKINTTQTPSLNSFDYQQKSEATEKQNDIEECLQRGKKLSLTIKNTKIMIIGLYQIGKQKLVDLMFGEKEILQSKKYKTSSFSPVRDEEEKKPCLDLTVKTVQKNETQHIFKFWIQNLDKTSFDNFSDILEGFQLLLIFSLIVYYKSINIFFLTFSIYSKLSLELLKKQYLIVKKALNDKEIKCIIIGLKFNNENNSKREVSIEDVEDFAKQIKAVKLYQELNTENASKLKEDLQNFQNLMK